MLKVRIAVLVPGGGEILLQKAVKAPPQAAELAAARVLKEKSHERL